MNGLREWSRKQEVEKVMSVFQMAIQLNFVARREQRRVLGQRFDQDLNTYGMQ